MHHSVRQEVWPHRIERIGRPTSCCERVETISIDGTRDFMPAGSELTSLFSSAPWISALRRTYGFEMRASVLFTDGEITAALPYCEIDDVRGRRVLSLPFCDYLDPIVDGIDNWEKLLRPVLKLGAPLRLRCLRDEIATTDGRLAKSSTALWHGTDLTRSEPEIWQGLHGKAREKVRRAIGAGMAVRHGRTLEDVRDFFDLHCFVRKNKYRMFAQPFSFFENIFDEFSVGENIRVLRADLNGQPVAASVFLIHGGKIYYKFNASRGSVQGANDLLLWSALQFGRERGLTMLDFGVSDIDQPGLVAFKRKFATEELPLWQLRWAPENYRDPRGEQGATLLNDLTRILTEPAVPDDVTRSVGNEVYRYFC